VEKLKLLSLYTAAAETAVQKTTPRLVKWNPSNSCKYTSGTPITPLPCLPRVQCVWVPAYRPHGS